MKPLSAETRALLDDLRAVERVSPSQVDHAWRRFTASQARRRRLTRGLWLGTGLAVAAAAVLLVPSLRTRLGRADATGPTEAIMQREGEAAREVEAASTRRSAAASSADDARDSGAPVHEASADAPEPASASPSSSRRPAARASRGAAAGPAEPASASAPSLAAELALLDDAETALRDGDLARARRLLGDHRERFPAGALVEERRLLDARLDEASK